MITNSIDAYESPTYHEPMRCAHNCKRGDLFVITSPLVNQAHMPMTCRRPVTHTHRAVGYMRHKTKHTRAFGVYCMESAIVSIPHTQ